MGWTEDMETRGFAVHPRRFEDAARRLRSLFDDLGLDDGRPYLASNVHCPVATAVRIDAAIRAELGGLLDDLLPGYRPFLASFIAKSAHTGSRVAFHHDWTYTDERVAPTVIAWMPLVDVGPSNGVMSMVVGSHRWSDGIRPGPGTEPAAEHQARLADRAVPVPLTAAQVLTYHPAVFHGSSPNVSGEVRPAAAIAFAPVGAPLLHFHRRPDGTMSGHEVDEAFFVGRDFTAEPTGFAAVAPWAPPTDDHWVHALTSEAGPRRKGYRPRRRLRRGRQ